jgi:hypothetical protein
MSRIGPSETRVAPWARGSSEGIQARPGEADRGAAPIAMLARRRRLEIGDVLKVLAP